VGRKRSDYICPKCGKTGSLEQKPTSYDRNGNARRSYRYVVHFEKDNRSRCYIENILRKQENVEYLKQTLISDEGLQDLLSFTYDAMPIIAGYNLTPDQLGTLSPAQKQEYLNLRDRYVSTKTKNKNKDKIVRIEQQKLRKLSGIKTDEEKLKVSTIKPPREYWGESNTRDRLLQLSREFQVVGKHLSKPPWEDSLVGHYQIQVSKQFSTLSKQMSKVAKQVYHFRPATPEIDQNQCESFDKWYHERIKPLYMIFDAMGLQLGLEIKYFFKPPRLNNLNSKKYKILERVLDLKSQFKLILDILVADVTQFKYLADERYAMLFTQWLKVARDRYTQAIHASAALNPMLTGISIMRLKVLNQDKIDEAVNQAKVPPEPKSGVLKISIKRELTTKQVKNYTAPKGPLFRDLINLLKGEKAAMQLGLIKENKQINDLLLNATFLNLSF
jgi:hypothetical protein